MADTAVDNAADSVATPFLNACERNRMGTLFYDGARFDLEDRVLAHLQVIVSLKLRRAEGFFLSWEASDHDGEGRHVIWIDNGVPLRIRYQSAEPPRINREWAQSLALSANTNNGLIITAEGIEAAGDHEESEDEEKAGSVEDVEP